mmetsp:Transcript_35448/g.62228  ORF Transcript_35448/g.62228 Transcript_35448/m.62228 type:complete len:374 (-) Transcript_35448:131-1252(-)
MEIEGAIQDFSAGSQHTFFIEEGGTAYAAGFVESDFGYRGHLGVGEIEDCKNDKNKLCEGENDPLTIKTVIDPSGEKLDAPPFKRVYAGVGIPADSGEMHSVLIAQNGKVYITGNNNKGQLCLGDDKIEYVDEFHEVSGIPGRARAAAVGDEFTLILTEDGEVWGCGSNEVGQIGQGDNTDYSNKPVRIKELTNIIDLSTGLSFAIFLEEKGRVWGTGSNLYGQQCGFTAGEPMTNVHEIDIKGADKITQVETNRESSYFLFGDGEVRSCGRNDEGQLGNGDYANTSEINPIVKVALNERIIRIGSGPTSQSVFFIGEDSVWASGLNDRFQLGMDDIGSRGTPVKVDFQCDVEIEYVSSSDSHTVANGRYLNC